MNKEKEVVEEAIEEEVEEGRHIELTIEDNTEVKEKFGG